MGKWASERVGQLEIEFPTPHTPHPTPHPPHPKGVVLLVVLGMVALVALLGISFVTFSGQDEASARARSDAVTKSDPPSRSMDRAVEALIQGTDEPTASLRGHSLLRDLWGNDVVGRYDDPSVAPPQFRNGIVLNVNTGSPTPDLHPVPGPERFNIEINLGWDLTTAPPHPRVPEPRGYLNGRTLVFKGDSPLAKHYATIVSYEAVDDPRTADPNFLIGLVRVSPPLPTAPQGLDTALGTPPDEVLILQRPFNGTGDRNLLDPAEAALNFPLYPTESQNLSFVYNNRDPETRRDTTGNLATIGGFDEPWDMADLQNLFLAAIQTLDLLDPNDLNGNGNLIEPDSFLETTRVLLPSFYRPVPPADWTTLRGTAGDDPRQRLLRPRPVDQLARGPDGIIGINPLTGTTDDGQSPTGVVLSDPEVFPKDGFFGTADDTGVERVISLPRFLTTTFGNGIQQVAVQVGEDLDGDGIIDVTAIPLDGIPVDVDNDGDGMLDSIWIDAGLPIESRPDGTRAKPLVAFLVVDQDSKLNLNVHGNHAHNDLVLNQLYREVDRNADGTTDTVLVHGSNHGASPTEINLGRGMFSRSQDLLDNNSSGVFDEMAEHELFVGEPLEFLAVLTGRDDLMFGTGLVEGRNGEIGVLSAWNSGTPPPPRPGRTGGSFIFPGAPANPIHTADDDQDLFEWRRFGSPFLPTENAAPPPDYFWLGNPETTLNPVRDLFGLPDFDGDAYDQLRPWHTTWWGTVYNFDNIVSGAPEDTRETTMTGALGPRGLSSTLDRWATHNENVNDFENLNEADELNAYQLGPYDAPYAMTDLEWLLRGHDLGGERLESRLGTLAFFSFWSRFNAADVNPTFPLQPVSPVLDASGRPVLSTDGMLRRRLFTTQSWDFADYGLMPDVWRDGPPPTPDRRTTEALDTTELAFVNGGFNPWGESLPLAMPNPALPRLRPDPFVPVSNELVMPPDLAAGKRLNLNFLLGDGQDFDIAAGTQDGVVDEPTELIVISDGTPLAQYAINLGIGAPAGVGQWQLSGFQLRELQAHQNYALLRQIAYPADGTATLPGPVSVYDPAQDFDDNDNTPFEPGLLGQLAQLAANIVDFRDPDSFPTRFDFGGAGAGSPQVVYGVERPQVVIGETLIYLEEVDEDGNGEGDAFPSGDVGSDSGLWVELYNPGHPDRPTTTMADLNGYRLVLAKDVDADNKPDPVSAGQTLPFEFMTLGLGQIPLNGGEYLVAGTLPTANGVALNPNANYPNASFIQTTFNLTPLEMEYQHVFRWKIFLQRQTTFGEWVTVDQSRLRIWVKANFAMSDLQDPEQHKVTEMQLVSRERREPFRGGPDNNTVVPPGFLPGVPGAEFEYNDVTSPAGVVGGSAVRSHPDGDPFGTGLPTHTLGGLNWHSDVDDQNGDRMDVRATTLTKPLVDNNGDMKVDLADLDGDLVNLNDATATPLNPQLDGVPTVAWPPIPFDDPITSTNYLPSRAVGFDFLPWLDRDYANVGELLLVPGVPPSNLTALFHPEAGPPGGPVGTQGGRYAYLADFFEEHPTGGLGAPTGTPRGLYRLFEFAEVPSRQRGATDTSQPIGTENRNRRVTGKLNLNTIQDPLVYEGLIDNPLAVFPIPLLTAPMLPPAIQVLFDRLQLSRAGTDQTLGTPDDRPFVFGANGVDDMGTPRTLSLLRGTSSEALFTLPDDFGNEVQFPLDWMETNRTGEFRNPWFKTELLRKISSQVTNRSNVFAVWVTVGYFEVLEEPVADGADNDGDGEPGPTDAFGKFIADGVDNNFNGLIDEGIDEPDELVPRLGRELGSETGQVTRHRAFYVIDRTRSVGFDPDLEAKDTIIYRRIIE